ncbi:ribonucleoside-diphosphate reductase [Flexivirga endophytica]|uniref:Ribonucleoside-diphosphate reductase n=1 Tax=Flexivirga endophytica TaxID=1849103 RepID=A0A916T543_9MICO|nr:ribonucleoside-diphosphate reductase subunit alpha [Flexivirga endophytica]GGB30102.1 ribonucleoside-diphosphate reductase [Flexivirga endophytica]GHB51035.1 ribonucleoside-diphosphate reductase [Flexivirga endophytica]
MAIHVTKRDGSREPYDADRINRAIERAAAGLPDAMSMTMQIASELAITLFDGITTEQLDEAAISVAVQNVKDDPDFDVIASRLLLKTIYKKVLGDFETQSELALLHQARFPGYVRESVEDGLFDPRLASAFNLEQLAAALDHHLDDGLRYIGIVTLKNRYMATDSRRQPLEVPAYFWMRVAMGMSVNEKDPTQAAIGFYRKMASLDYLAAGSTLVNAGTVTPQLSNCFVMQMDDDIEHIAKSMRDVMWLTKGTGGIGLSVTKLRSEGSPIRSNNTSSTGPIPFMHTIDSILRAVSRGGKKFGALCFYMENWHLDFPQFIDLRQNAGDPYRRTRTANTAVWLSDEFMKRVVADDDWYLFDPLETPDLVELVGDDFSRRYKEYVALAETGKLRSFKKIRARAQWKSILVSLQTTSHPWLTWKDTINQRALNDNTGTIHLSNLCTEITLPQDRDNVSVCNLASINLSRHLNDDGTWDWDRLAESARFAVRQLDNLIDITRSSVPESEHSNDQNRAIGLGIMGFTDVVEKLGLSYASEEAADLIDKLTELISWHAIDASCDLAQERGAYPNFAGSGWSRGLVPIDTLDVLQQRRGVEVDVPRTAELDWDVLRGRVKDGIRNATLMAIAPTASIGLVAGTTPGLDPQFSQLFSRTTSSGKFLEVNRNLVAALQERGLWDTMREDLLRSRGDLSAVPGVPEDLLEVFQTSFQLPATAYLQVASRAQKWIDQAISRNIYLESRDIGGMSDLYVDAWRKGVKTTYYLHMKPRHRAEQSTVKVNKAVESGHSGSGFGFARRAAAPAASATATATVEAPAPAAAPAPVRETEPIRKPEPVVVAEAPASSPTPESDPPTTAPDAVFEEGFVCPTDPQELLNCEACQ